MNDPIDRLLVHLACATISDQGGCKPDAYLTLSHIQQAVKLLQGDLRVLVRSANDATSAGAMFDWSFGRLVALIREPYQDAIETLTAEMRRLATTYRDQEVQLVKSHQAELSEKDATLQTQLSRKEVTLRAEMSERLSEMEVTLRNELSEKMFDRETTLRAQMSEKESTLRLEMSEKESTLRLEMSEKEAIHRTEMSEKESTLRLEMSEKEATHRTEMSEKDARHRGDMIEWAADLRQLRHEKQQLQHRERLHQGGDSVPATTTHAQTWERVLLANPHELDYPLPRVPNAIPEDADDVVDLVNGVYDEESDTYDPLINFLQTHLSAKRTDSFPGVHIWPTHSTGKRSMLGGRKPDFTVTVGGTSHPDPHSIILIWEAKAVTDPISKASCGQLYTYIKLLSERQRQRQVFVGVLSNLTDSIVVVMTREGSRLRCRPYLPAKLGHVTSYLRDVVLKDDAHLPYIPAFSFDLGEIKARLGNPVLRDIALFATPKNLHTTFAVNRWVNPKFIAKENKVIVVKRRVTGNDTRPERPVTQEITMMRLIDDLNGHQNIAQLVFSCNTTDEFGMLPYGVPIKPGSDMMPWPTILVNILDGLQWLHDRDIIHRDLRWDNIIWNTDHAVIIDFGEAIHLSAVPQEPQFYAGGFVCVPRALIGRFDAEYVPRAEDDCFAFVQLVLTLLWPEHWRALCSANLAVRNSYEAMRVEAFWRKLETTPLWMPYVDAAEKRNYKVLAGMVDLCAYC